MVVKGTKTMTGVATNWTLISLCLLLACGPACAEDTDPIVPAHTFAMGLGVSYFDWEEDHPISDVGTDGLMYEVMGSYTYHNDIMIHTSIDYSMGNLDYDGYFALIPAGGGEVERYPWKTDVDTDILECRGLIGYDFLFRGKHILTPFLGLGYRYWKDDFRGKDDFEWSEGFEREIEYWYFPIGVQTRSALFDDWTWGITMEYDIFWDGESDSDLSYMPTLYLDSGYGARFSLRFSRRLTKFAALSFEPYITYWDIDESDLELHSAPVDPDSDEFFVFPWIEPQSTTTCYGLRISLEF